MRLLYSLLLCLALCSALRAAAPRPNILFILVDDQSPMDLKIYNPKSTLDTPNIDKLAAQGMVLEGAYHMGSFSGAVCMPSRHMIMSGRSVWHLPPAPWGKNTSPLALEQQTMPAVFNRAGYSTMRTCKMGNSYEAANKLFTIRKDETKRGGSAETGSAWHAERVLEHLAERKQSRSTQPSFIYYGFSHPHDERDGTPQLLAKYGAVNHLDEKTPPSLHSLQPPLPTSYLSQHPFENTDLGVRDEVAVSGVWRSRDEASIRNEIGRQNACSENIDIQIGRVMAELEAQGLLENTYIFYTADHGISIGRHGLMGKQNLYEHTWRVPFIVRGPGIQTGSRAEGNIYLMDVLATLCDLSGIPTPETNEGLSFRSVLEGKQSRVRDVMYGVYSGGRKPGMRAVKSGSWKLIQYEAPELKVKETQLFNLAENPEELLPEHRSGNPALTDLAEDPRYAEKLAEMKALLLEQMRKHDDPYRYSDQPGDDLPPPPPPAAKGKGKGKAKKAG